MVSLVDTGTLPWVVAQAIAAIALGLLGASGVAKLVDPAPTTGAMGDAGLPSSDLLSRLLGAAEGAAALVGLAVGGVAVLAGAVLYIGFAVFTFGALRNRTPLASCGCFGRDDTPPTVVHVVFNGLAALALLVLPLLRTDPIDWSMAPFEILLYAAFAAIGGYISYLLLALLPRLMATTR